MEKLERYQRQTVEIKNRMEPRTRMDTQSISARTSNLTKPPGNLRGRCVVINH